ncbi:testis-expressed protein 2-like isoform X1 [Oxyura jamaicensis]|uniref:testis-expressed protein 2-like isoform X1 n=1 Tax=Oxyura jamaicensis TaxID=8884 RepID=UPI0015A5D29B|nr:testis-expressed protein 2-like isoform X1 [Oxyura jamaicensis]XP_035195908.1 testis-expressed protein 2-like isoform X1 [Oxyura jamaicensis]XP_035195909.1 testis-expressed protein 2-like isoform X1 [Oxyura jamaicensis]XP_035195910.1 testis-expressed protein 2-like isoform X1 [Oxyura jamaicensis]
MRAMAEQAVAAADASPSLAPSPGSPWHRDSDGTKSHLTSAREDSGGRDGCGIVFPMDGDTKPLPSPQPSGMLLADIPRGPQPRLSLAKSRTAPSSPSVSPSESRAALLRLREAKLEDTKRRLSEAVQEPLVRLSRLMAEESSPTARLKAGGSPGRGEPGGRGAGGRRVRDWSPWEPSLNCRYEICSYGDVIQVVEVVQQEAEPPEQPPAARPGGSVPGRALACVALLAYGYLVLPLPPYTAGLCLGLTCGLLLGFLAILLLLLKPPPPRGRLRPELLPGGPRGAHGLQGWLNQLHVYDPELYHPSLTHSVLATLDGATLKLSYPKNNIPRRATFAEEILDATFISHHCYDMTDAKVFLCPPRLARKRLWNKKYPICILFPARADTEHRSSDEHGTELQGDEGTKKPQVPTQDVPGDCRERCLYLFGRTGREKEEWYQHLLRACHGTPSSSHGEARPGVGLAPQSAASSSGGSTEDIPSATRPKDLAGNVRQKIFLDYSTYMARFVPAEAGGSPEQSPPPSVLSSPAPMKALVASPHPQLGEDAAGRSEGCTAWANALVGRIFWDFLRERYWAEQVASKIQKKLSKIKLPYFMNELTLTELDMGTSIPSILSTSKPTINDRGLWVDMEVTYSGSLQMTLETKMNLCKLGKEGTAEDSGPAEAGGEGARPRLILLADSDAESSSAGSSDEEDIAAAEPAGALGERVPPPGTEGHVSGNSTGRKILRFVDKIAKSKYFQKATENEFIKKKIEEVSNTPLLLTVEVQELAGTLAVNVPPPPTDRVWYSFRVPPQLELKVRPKLGEREVTFLHVIEWIEKKLQHEFQKILVMPNMDDLIVPIMNSGLDPQPPAGELPRDLPAKGERRL